MAPNRSYRLLDSTAVNVRAAVYVELGGTSDVLAHQRLFCRADKTF